MAHEAYEYGPSRPAIDELIAQFGDRVSLSDAVREKFGKDESFHPSLPPDAVVTPQSA
ncbi:MAG TPA: FAD-binding oxidoreductase, partial [Gammaproteobacteria bacterium]|nr:FAD-binding oxidoreductase [Gammaproteobacteria bacterium]